ncbi:MAG: UDP-2,3-diacylglucosamine diphosphatase [Betaproteobacteria bacterium]
MDRTHVDGQVALPLNGFATPLTPLIPPTPKKQAAPSVLAPTATPAPISAPARPAMSPARDDTAARRYRAIFVSDTHLGTRGCKAEHLLDFLRHHECDVLYLVGDVIDGWAMKKGLFWPQSHNDVVQKVLRKARKGTQVVYIPGNHDEFGRQFIGLDFGGIAIREDAVHVLADGRRLWVVHGDFADGVIRHAKWLAHVGDTLYDLALWLNRMFNRVRARMGLGYWSLSQYLKHKVKNAVSFISDFEQTLTREARRRGYDGVVCGHIHRAEIRDVDGLLYCNDGDWVESLTALVETHSGELHLIEWRELLAPGRPVPRWNEPEEAVQPAAVTA